MTDSNQNAAGTAERRLPMVVRQFYVLIGGPSDTNDFRWLARDVVERWNRVHGLYDAIRLQPLLWELDARPTLTVDGQEAVNLQLVDEAHAMIAIFYARLGSPTPRSKSGTVEEIFRLHGAGQEVVAYFSADDKIPRSSARDIGRLERFQKELAKLGLYGRFKDADDLKRQLEEHVEHLSKVLAQRFPMLTGVDVVDDTDAAPVVTGLDPYDEALLLRIAQMRVETDNQFLSLAEIATPQDDEYAIRESLEVLKRLGFINRIDQAPIEGGFAVQRAAIQTYMSVELPNREEAETRIAALVEGGTAADVDSLSELVGLPKVLVEEILLTWRDEQLATVSRTMDGTAVRALGVELRRRVRAFQAERSKTPNAKPIEAIDKACLTLLPRGSVRATRGRIDFEMVIRNEGTAPAWDLDVSVSTDDGSILSAGTRADSLDPDATRAFSVPVPRPEMGDRELPRELAFRIRAGFRDRRGKDEAMFRVVCRGKGADWTRELDRDSSQVSRACVFALT